MECFVVLCYTNSVSTDVLVWPNLKLPSNSLEKATAAATTSFRIRKHIVACIYIYIYTTFLKGKVLPVFPGQTRVSVNVSTTKQRIVVTR